MVLIPVVLSNLFGNNGGSLSLVSGMVLIPVVLSNLFGNDVIADAFGLSLLFGGLAGMIGPSLTGLTHLYTCNNINTNMIYFSDISSGKVLHIASYNRSKHSNICTVDSRYLEFQGTP